MTLLILAMIPLGARSVGAAEFALDFTSPAEQVEGAPGEVKTIPVLALLTTRNNPEPDGAMGWSIGMGIEGGTIEEISLEGVHVDTVYDEDDDADLLTPPIHHASFLQEVSGERVFFKLADQAFRPEDPSRKGVISAVALSVFEPMTLQPNGTQPVAWLTVTGVIPESDCALITLRFEDGLRSPGTCCIRNVVTFRGASVDPSLGLYTIELCSKPVVEIPFRRGDVTANGERDVSDVISLLGFLFLHEPESLACKKSADFDDSGELDITDAIALLGKLFLGNVVPIPPYEECGLDDSPDDLPCESFPPCP